MCDIYTKKLPDITVLFLDFREIERESFDNRACLAHFKIKELNNSDYTCLSITEMIIITSMVANLISPLYIKRREVSD